MNNRQVAVLAAATRTGGRTMTSVQDMLDDALVIEEHLRQRDEQARAEERARDIYGPPDGVIAAERIWAKR